MEPTDNAPDTDEERPPPYVVSEVAWIELIAQELTAAAWEARADELASAVDRRRLAGIELGLHRAALAGAAEARANALTARNSWNILRSAAGAQR